MGRPKQARMASWLAGYEAAMMLRGQLPVEKWLNKWPSGQNRRTERERERELGEIKEGHFKSFRQETDTKQNVGELNC